jgi:hypothetical protein
LRREHLRLLYSALARGDRHGRSNQIEVGGV